jgi:hypothetical protein
LKWIVFGVQSVDTVDRWTTSYLLAGPTCLWCLVFFPFTKENFQRTLCPPITLWKSSQVFISDSMICSSQALLLVWLTSNCWPKNLSHLGKLERTKSLRIACEKLVHSMHPWWWVFSSQ